MDKKTLIFFIDGADWNLINSWIEANELPALKKIKENSAWGNLESVIPTTTNIAIPSFYFGKDPSRLKTFYLSDSDAFFINSHTFKEHKTLWEYLSEAGYRSLILDLPFTYPSRKFNGVMFTGFFTPSNSRDYIYPSSLIAEYPNYPLGGVEFIDKVFRDKDTILEEEIIITQRRFDAFLDQVKTESFDVACFYVLATDLIQHFIWEKKRDILGFYRLLDDFLKKLDELHTFENILIISDHGFGKAPTISFYVNTWLEKNGFLQWKKRTKDPIRSFIKARLEGSRFLSKLFYQTRYRVFSLLNKENQEKIKKEVSGAFPKIKTNQAIDFEKSLAYAVAGVLHGRGIKINKRLIKTETERAELIQKIKNKLKELNQGDKPVIKLIKDAKDIYYNYEKMDLPDIVFLTDDNFFVDDRFNKEIFTERKTRSRATGHHMSSINGIFAWQGKNIKPGKYNDLSLLDIFPTLLSLYGVKLPNDLDGRVISEIFQANSLSIKKENAQPQKEELLAKIDF